MSGGNCRFGHRIQQPGSGKHDGVHRAHHRDRGAHRHHRCPRSSEQLKADVGERAGGGGQSRQRADAHGLDGHIEQHRTGGAHEQRERQVPAWFPALAGRDDGVLEAAERKQQQQDRRGKAPVTGRWRRGVVPWVNEERPDDHEQNQGDQLRHDDDVSHPWAARR